MLATKDERMRCLLTEVATLQNFAARAKKNASFDQVAREGQTKKLGILEHNVITLRHDLRASLGHRCEQVARYQVVKIMVYIISNDAKP